MKWSIITRQVYRHLLPTEYSTDASTTAVDMLDAIVAMITLHQIPISRLHFDTFVTTTAQSVSRAISTFPRLITPFSRVTRARASQRWQRRTNRHAFQYVCHDTIPISISTRGGFTRLRRRHKYEYVCHNTIPMSISTRRGSAFSRQRRTPDSQHHHHTSISYTRFGSAFTRQRRVHLHQHHWAWK